MSYHCYFYKVKREDIRKIREINWKEAKPLLLNDSGYYGGFESDNFMRVLSREKVLDLGRFVFFYNMKTAHEMNKMGKPLFKDKKVKKELSYYDPYVLKRVGFYKALEIYKDYEEKEYGISDFTLSLDIDWEKEAILFYGC